MSMNPRLLVPRANFDADAAAYIRAVEAADTQALEAGVKRAIDNFVRGCKRDGIWSAIKASCILAGARTLTGALTPLVGTAPTNNGPFVSGDYNRKTGLVGNGSTKYLNSNRNNNADPQDNKHVSLYNSSSLLSGAIICGAGATAGRTSITEFGGVVSARLNNSSPQSFGAATSSVTGFTGASRSSSASFQWRHNGATNTATVASDGVLNENIGILARVDNTLYSTTRIAFYSIGESLNLALLDSRVSALITAIGAAI